MRIEDCVALDLRKARSSLTQTPSAPVGSDSRMDAMIAMRMRVTGHSREAVQAAITDCAPTIEPERRRKEGRNWQSYAERTVNFAFGIAGDVALMRYERIFDYWRKVEGEAQQEQSRVRLQ